MRFLALSLFSAACAYSAPFSFGVKAGVPLTDFFDSVSSSNFKSTTNRYIIGPTAELHLPFGFSVEVDALYRHFNYAVPSNSTTGSAWEFPLLGKYHFTAPVVRPYIDAGIAWDKLSGLSQAVTTLQPEVRHDVTTGFVIGGGFELRVPFLRLSPEIRYTRWGAQHFLDPNGGFSSNQNQAEFLLGITF